MLLDNTVNIYVINSHYVWFHIYESQYKKINLQWKNRNYGMMALGFEEGTKEVPGIIGMDFDYC